MVSFDERVGEESHSHRFESFIRDREEDSTDVDHISWTDGSSLVAVKVNHHRARNVSNGYLVGLEDSTYIR